MYFYMDHNKKSIQYFKAHYNFSWRWIREHLIELGKEETQDAWQIALTLFTTGSRATEAYEIKRSMIDLYSDPDNVWIRGQMVEKQRTVEVIKDIRGKPLLLDGKKQFTYMPKSETRSYPLFRSEPTTKQFVKLIEFKDEQGIKPDDRILPYDRRAQYYRLSLVGAKSRGLEHLHDWNQPQYRSGLWSHLYRSLKATSLIATYQQYQSNIPLLMAYFGWSTDEMALRYIKITPDRLAIPPENMKNIRYV
jgi:hypothetical protein